MGRSFHQPGMEKENVLESELWASVRYDVFWDAIITYNLVKYEFRCLHGRGKACERYKVTKLGETINDDEDTCVTI